MIRLDADGDWASRYAYLLLAERLPMRWIHSVGVQRQAKKLHLILGEDSDLLVQSAILHDVGYAPEAIDTGQHMIDGARLLREHGVDPRICAIVAHHASSEWEAQELGLSDALAEFPVQDPDLVDAITYCDLRVGPNGEEVEPRERLAEVLRRYGPNHVVHRAVSKAYDALLARVDRVEERLIGSNR